MRRSICSCEPSFTRAGETNTWKFHYTTSTDLPKGTKVKFDIESSARHIDWEIPQTNIKNKKNLIWGEMPNGKTIAAEAVLKENINLPYFLFILPSDIAIGETFTIFIGTPNKDVDKSGNRAQTYNQRRKSFNLYINTKGEEDFKDPEVFLLDIRGNKLSNLKIITPSFVDRNKRFDIIVRFEDDFGNLTNFAAEDTLIELSYQHLRENLNWKLFVPETGFLTLPNLYFNEPGSYRIQLKNLKTNQLFYSPPILCFQESNLNLFWGILHGESTVFNTTTEIESCLRHVRDEKALNFFAASSFDDENETPNEAWKKISLHISEFNEEDRFIAMLGFQWAGTPHEEGLRQIIYTKDTKPILRKKDLKNNSLKKIYKTYSPKEIISIPSFTMGKEAPFDFADYNPQFERVAEIYNAWGSSEMVTKDKNLRPIMTEKGVINSSQEGSIQEALNNNCRFGFVAGGLDDRGIYKNLYDSDQKQYSPGLTGIISKDLTRDSLIDALYNRMCYATTGKRILVGLYIAQKPIGSELNTIEKPGLAFNRYLTGFIIGTDEIKEVSIIRNGKIFKTFHPKKDEIHFAFDDSEHISKVAINSKDKPPFIYYYVRAEQKDGHIAWSSPIWVDLLSSEKELKNIKGIKKR